MFAHSPTPGGPIQLNSREPVLEFNLKQLENGWLLSVQGRARGYAESQWLVLDKMHIAKFLSAISYDETQDSYGDWVGKLTLNHEELEDDEV